MIDMLDDKATQEDPGEGEETKAGENGPFLVRSFGVDLEFLRSDNMSFYWANKAYYENRNYAKAIEEFKAAIKYERSHPLNFLGSVEDSTNQIRTKRPNDVIAKSMYWIGESYIKLNQIDQALEMLEQLSRNFRHHYLGLAAQRRSAALAANQKWECAKKDQEERHKAFELRKQKRESEKQRKLELQRQKEEEKRIRRRPLEPFIQAAKQVLGTQIKVTIDSPNLNPQDIQLALEWYKGPKKPVILQQFRTSGFNKDLLIEIENDHDELERVLSARAAEKSVMEFYQRYGYYVEDVSIHWLTSESPDWEQYDLKINEFSFDVKNSRRSKQNPNSYVEHCVPSFKQDRSNRDVTIAGVLSPDLSTSQILNPNSSMNQDSPILFLGLTNINKLTEIRNEFEIPNLLEINLQRPNRKGLFLPGWIFDYPKFLYEQRDNELNKIVEQTVPEHGLWKEFNLNPIPLCTAAGIDLGQLWSSEVLADWKRSFLSAVLDLRKKYDLSLPYLFLGILKHFLQMVSGNEDIDYRPTRYKKLIYDPNLDPNHNMPLGIYDPLNMIYSLITSLDTLWDAKHGLIRSFRAFKLQGLNILRGCQEEDKKWKTLIAYCGGPKCGKDPLVLGDHEHCRKCGMLICSDCQFCSDRCSEYYLRRHKSDNSQ